MDDFLLILVKIVYNPGKKPPNVRNFQTKKKKKKKCPPKIWSVGGGGESDNVRQNVLYAFPNNQDLILDGAFPPCM